MTNTYKNIELDRGIYKSGKSFNDYLETKDPSNFYKGTELETLDAFQRQLKRFDIKVSGFESDRISKFFSVTQSAALFPEYVRRAVSQGINDKNILSQIVATTTKINSLDYRTISTSSQDEDKELKVVAEGGHIPTTTIKLKENLVKLTKRGRMLVASYEAIKFQKLDLFTVALKEIGNHIAVSQLKDAVNVLMNGDDGKTPAKVIKAKTANTLTYDDLIRLWSEFENYEMNTLIVAHDVMVKLLSISELKDPMTGLNFQATGKLTTPLGANLIRSSSVPAGKIIALDKNFALEQVCADEVSVDYDKLIDCQMERAAVTSIVGFSKIIPDAVRVLSLN